jgi:hypothetical protein
MSEGKMKDRRRIEKRNIEEVGSIRRTENGELNTENGKRKSEERSRRAEDEWD